MVELKFQRATLQDLPLLYKLAKEIWIPTFAPLFTEIQLSALFAGMYNDELLTQWISQKGNELYFIYASSDAIGYMAVEKHPEVLKLDKIYIHPSTQGKGYGGIAMNKIEQIAIEAGLLTIQLRVNRGNALAIAFYKNRNFTITESIDFPGPAGFTYEDYLMNKELPD